MSYIPDSGPDTGNTARSFEDRLWQVKCSWPKDTRSVVDFGAYRGRFVNELCEDLGISGVAIEGEYELMEHPSVERVDRFVTARELGAIIRDQEDPTVLCLSVLHHLPDWQKFAGVIERNAKYAFIETANPGEVLPAARAHDQSAAIWRWCEKRGTKVHESPGWDGRFMRPTWLLKF